MSGLHNTGTNAAREDVVLYARVSQEIQAKGESVSIDQQIADMQALCERMGWNVTELYVDAENYRATQAPDKGKVVNPSGERVDRPAFVRMLELVRTGNIDAVMCWRDDRLVRHPRVAVALEDALDVGDVQRNGKGRIKIVDATGATIDRFTLSIKATIWREENKRRAERSTMGKIATLQQGRWPGSFNCYGYKIVKEPGKRGNLIVLDPETVPIVRRLFEDYASGKTLTQIRRGFIADGLTQCIFPSLRRYEWSRGLIYHVLRKEVYMGKASWRLSNGTTMEIDVPQIIEPELWQRVQEMMQRNKWLCKRNAKGVYLLQGLLRCGECGNGLSVARSRTMGGQFCYRCHTAINNHLQGEHASPYSHGGLSLDWAVWRYIVDNGIMRPDLIRAEVEARRKELRAEGENVHGEIAHARLKLESVEEARAFFQRQAARGKISEREFDTRMDETEAEEEHWRAELVRLLELRDNAERVQSGLDYATEFMTALQSEVCEIDQTPKQMRKLPEEEREAILLRRRKIITALCEEIIVWADKRVRLIGVLDGTEIAEFESRDPLFR